MKKITRFALLSLVLLWVSINSYAANGLSVKDAQTFLHDSGLDALIDSLAPTMQQQLNLQKLSEANQLQFEEAEAAIIEAIQSVQNPDLAMQYLTTQADADSLKETMRFLSSPLGKRVTTVERESSTPEAQLEMQAYIAEMAKSPPPRERIELINSLTNSLNADKVMLTLMRGIFYSLLDVTQGLSPNASSGLKDALDAEWNRLEPVLTEQFKQFMTMGSHYSYRNLSDGDLKDYIAFLNTNSGQVYWMTGVEIINIYLKAFSSELVTILKRQRV